MLGSCQKEVESQNATNSTEETQTRTPLSCDLTPITISPANYALLAQELTGDYWEDWGLLDDHFACVHGAPLAGGPCCGPTCVYMDGFNNTYTYATVEFESWGPNTAAGQYDYLSDNVCSVSEQEAFIDRVYTAAASNTPPCGGGYYNPVAYNVDWSPLPNPNGTNPGVAIFVKVLYTSVCLF